MQDSLDSIEEESERARVAEVLRIIEEEGKKAIDSSDKDILIRLNEQLQDIYTAIIQKDPTFWVYWLNNIKSRKDELTNQSEADYHINKAEQAVESGDIDELQRHVRSLLGMLPKETQEEIANVQEKTRELELKWQNEKKTLNEIGEIKKTLESLRTEADNAELRADLTRVAEIRYGQIPELTKELHANLEKLRKLQKTRRILKEEITEEDIAGVVARWTGIPVSRMLEEEQEKLVRMEEELGKRVIGQREAIGKVSDAVRRSRAGVNDPERPIGSFMFLGPTGVGKTELTKALAEFIFNDEKALIKVDMSEYMEKHSTSKLIGSPPGYVGYEESGQLTEAVRHRPYAVILFDEVEKAHPEVFNLLLQVLDEGRLTDSKGRVVNFKNTIIVMTSNIGSQYIQKMEQIGFGNGEVGKEYVQVKERVLEALKEYFKPEFLNRLDDTVIFDVLVKDEIKQIVRLQVADIAKRLAQKEIVLEVSDEAVALIAEKSFDPHYGARPIRRY
jgi:ATP-dependent Clp protease ATP-binding subunit ClpB